MTPNHTGPEKAFNSFIWFIRLMKIINRVDYLRFVLLLPVTIIPLLWKNYLDEGYYSFYLPVFGMSNAYLMQIW
jgi:hypothetical protein